METFIFLRINPATVMVVLFFIVLLFGANKLPELSRNLGRSARILKDELQDLTEQTVEQPPVDQDGKETKAIDSEQGTPDQQTEQSPEKDEDNRS